MYRLSNRSRRKLIGVNPILAYIVTEAIKQVTYDFTVIEGVRTLKRQRQLVNRGVSWTMHSKHLTGNAVDLVPYINGRPVWSGKEANMAFTDIYKVMNKVANGIGIKLRCGYDWKKTPDLPHYELTSAYDDGYNYLKVIK